MAQHWDGSNWTSGHWDANNWRGPNEADTGIRWISANLSGSGALAGAAIGAAQDGGAKDDERETVDPYLTRRELVRWARGAKVRVKRPQPDTVAAAEPLVAPSATVLQRPTAADTARLERVARDAESARLAALAAAAAQDAALAAEEARRAAEQDDEEAIALILALAA